MFYTEIFSNKLDLFLATCSFTKYQNCLWYMQRNYDNTYNEITYTDFTYNDNTYNTYYVSHVYYQV